MSLNTEYTLQSFPMMRRCWYFSPERQLHSTNCPDQFPFPLFLLKHICTTGAAASNETEKECLSLWHQPKVTLPPPLTLIIGTVSQNTLAWSLAKTEKLKFQKSVSQCYSKQPVLKLNVPKPGTCVKMQSPMTLNTQLSLANIFQSNTFPVKGDIIC